MKIKAYVNHGDWKARCPKCGIANLVKTSDATFICAGCHPGLRAMAFTPKPSNPKLFIPVPDFEERATAYKDAKQSGEIYELEFVIDPRKVYKLLSARKRENMNWFPGETLKTLERENEEHGIEVK